MVWGGGQVDCPLWHIGSMTGVSVQDNADKRFHIKALPERRRGHRGRRDGRGMGRHGQRICQQWRREMNETCRKEAAGR